MTRRQIHYEGAFEDFLRVQGIPYVAVDESKRAIFGRAALKSFDFVVYSPDGPNLIVDIKGRKFPDTAAVGKKRASRAWENWITRQDVEGLEQWEGVFGGDFRAVLVFAYWLQGTARSSPFEDVFFHRNGYYAFMTMTLGNYVSLARPRSRKWQTISVPGRTFADNAVDVRQMMGII